MGVRRTRAQSLNASGKCLIKSLWYSEKEGWGLVRVTGRTFSGREHWASVTWIGDPEQYADFLVRDATLAQFTRDVPAVFHGGLDAWFDQMSELLNDHLDYVIYEPGADLDGEAAYEIGEWIREDIEPGDMQPSPWLETSK